MALQSLEEPLTLLRPAEEWLNTGEDLTRFTFPLGSMTVLMTAEERDWGVFSIIDLQYQSKAWTPLLIHSFFCVLTVILKTSKL